MLVQHTENQRENPLLLTRNTCLSECMLWNECKPLGQREESMWASVCVCVDLCTKSVQIPSGGHKWVYSKLKLQIQLSIVRNCLGQDSDGIHTLIHFRPHKSNTSLSPPTAFPFPACPAGWLTSRAAWLCGGCPVYQSISRLRAQRWGRQSVSQAVWWRAEGLMRVSERRSPTFPRRLAASRACGGGFASFSRPLRFLRSSGSYSFPARKQPSPATAGGRGVGGSGGCNGMGGVEGKERSLASKWVQGLVQQALGLNHKALTCLGRNQRQPQWWARRARASETEELWERERESGPYGST